MERSVLVATNQRIEDMVRKNIPCNNQQLILLNLADYCISILKKNIIQLGKEMYFFLLLDSIALYI
jgi:hypothetical protein